jgi:XRE family transcriptional regulator, fatty acid utilization regulator
LLKVNSFDQVLNNYTAAYFGVCLLVPKDPFVEDLKRFFALPTWQPEAFLQLMQRYRIGPEVIFQRFNVLSDYFDLRKVFFLRIIHHTESGSFEIDKELHLNRRHTPHSSGVNDLYCRRWVSMQLLQDLSQGDNERRIKAGAGRMRFADSAEEYLCISVAKLGLPNPSKQVSIMIGIEVDTLLKSTVLWLDDPAIQSAVVGVTCDRCAVANCDQRRAQPTTLDRIAARKKVEETLNKLTNS